MSTTTIRSPRRRLPIEPLENWLNVRYRNVYARADLQTGGKLSARRIGELIGFTPTSVQRWRTAGMPLWSADTAAIRAGTHPLELWPDFHASSDIALPQLISADTTAHDQ